MTPRAGLAATLPLLLLLAGGCAADPDDGSDAADGAAPASGVTLDCADPPPPPEDVTAFPQDDLPDPWAGAEEVTATIRTTCGDLVVDLAAGAAPQTVASFAFLAEQGWWEDSPCHRVTTSGIFVLQCGDPTGTGRGNPGYGYGVENAPDDGRYPPGTLAMARTQDPDSNGGQFFIVYQETQLPTQGGGYTVFGQVTEGLEIVEAVAAEGAEGGAADGAPARPVSILEVEVREGG
ncbi:peptidylprolyl isomerase [Ornithinimicrobium sp. W1665]|uniref:peptidylprolyl isomerase n=1 Tax=Ornithinimicrobium sp. W1665 TaxID=3416666 RepID=UPI003CF84F8C